MTFAPADTHEPDVSSLDLAKESWATFEAQGYKRYFRKTTFGREGVFPGGNGIRLLLRTPTRSTVPIVCQAQPSACNISFISSSLKPWQHGASISTILQMEKVRLRDQSLAQRKEDNNPEKIRI